MKKNISICARKKLTEEKKSEMHKLATEEKKLP
jgi:hypothetical protein